jgi:HEAT repeat protein
MAVVAVWLSGCGRAEPTVAGGRPVSFWIEALQSPDAKLRQKAVFKLGNVGPADAAAYPALVSALNDAHADVRCEAIVALLKFGSTARDSIPVLIELQRQDRDARVRSHAARALEKLRGG